MKGKEFTNKEIAFLLEKVAAALVLNQAEFFRIKAYEEAGETIKKLGTEVKDIWDEGKIVQIPGIGKNIAKYLDELFKTGKVKHFQQILKPYPDALFELLKVPGIGPKTAHKLTKFLKLKRAKTAISELKKALLGNKISSLTGFGEKSQQDLLKRLKDFGQKEQRLTLLEAEIVAEQVVLYLKKCPQVIRVDTLGSLRRKCVTVGDIDLAAASNRPEKVINWFIKYPKTTRIIEKGGLKARIIVLREYQVDLMVEPVESYGALLQHFTGSKEHNIHLRKIVLDKGWSLSEKGIKQLQKLKHLSGLVRNQETKIFKDEKSLYNFLGMSEIPAELREDRGEIEASLNNKLPKLVELKDIKGDLHLHSDFDIETSHDEGISSMEEIVKKAKLLGYQYLAFAEHNPSFSKHNQNQIMTIIRRKKEIIDKLNYSYNKSTLNNVFIFNSLEIDIKPNGDLAIPVKTLDWLDFGIASIHSSFLMKKEEMTKRILKGLNHSKIKILGHPTGRMLGKRESYEVDWEKVFKFCQINHKILEINAYPNRLDLPDYLIFEAKRMKIMLCINTDSHEVSQMDLMKYGVDNAKRGWLSKENIVNTLGYNNIRKILTSNEVIK